MPAPPAFTDTPLTAPQAVAAGFTDQAMTKEPDTYWAGFRKGLSEGASGGWTGFVKGIKGSPANLASGVKALVTTNPVTTIEQTAAGIGRIPEAVRRAGTNPEEWGESVGNLTGQTMLTSAAPTIIRGAPGAVKAAIPAAVRTTAAIGDVVDPAIIGSVSPRTGNIVRAAQRMRKALPDATPSTVPDLKAAIDQAVAEGTLRRMPEGMTPPVRDVMGRPTGKPTIEPRPSPVPAEGGSAQAIGDVLTKASAEKIKLNAAEVKAAGELVARGLTPGDAVAKVLHMREFMQKYNLPSSAEVKAIVKERNLSGEWGEKH
jgi:microcompartment protein CcmL/EutN